MRDTFWNSSTLVAVATLAPLLACGGPPVVTTNVPMPPAPVVAAPIDLTVPPTLGPPPALRLPPVTTRQLPTG